jgi:xylose isomerase
MTHAFFEGFSPIKYEGSNSTNPMAFRHYNPDEVVLGKRLEDHLRFAVAYWHSFAWEGGDPFGGPTFERPWHPQNSMENARLKADIAFDMFALLGQPYFCFHDADIRPDQGNFADNLASLNEITDYIGAKMQAGGPKLLWGTANMFSHRRWMAGASTNPDPDMFAFAAATVKSCIDATHKLGGENYVLWGGREGYETLLNTDLGAELDHMGRFLNMVVDYKHKIGFKGTILVEPKPQEPSKHQYDYDAATCIGFLRKYGLENEVKLNLEQGHAILAGHSFEHELAVAAAEGMLGSIDMNRNDYQSGWDTDQFPNNVPEVALAYYHVLKSGGFSTGGTNFDAKLRRQSLTAQDLLAGHIGAMDICARGLKSRRGDVGRWRIGNGLETALCGLANARGAKHAGQ